jgi:5-oxopent-3-ene-1,2,5-tricarboxylate decarboxylase / 2-hydroxyhepta-2,4-diene-1,7-dioate isomerase
MLVKSSFDVPPYRLTGVVVGALLNHAPQRAALGEAAYQPPYKAPPAAPVLAVKPRNTFAVDGDALVVPAGEAALEVAGSLGIVIGRVACRVPTDQALSFVAGYLVVADVAVPHASHYRPAVRWHARDGFCPLGARVVPADQIADPDALAVSVHVDGERVQSGTTGERVRGVARLIADVTEFMTLQAGDVLLLGPSADAPQVRAGQHVTVSIEGVGTLSHPLVVESTHATVTPAGSAA